MTPNKLTIAGLGALVITAALALLWQHQQLRRQAAESVSLREQLAALTPFREENQRLATRLEAAEKLAESERSELARLRGQAAVLRQAEQENARLKTERDNMTRPLQEARTAKEDGDEGEQSPEVKQNIARMTFAKQWGLALLMFADDHNGRLPGSPAELAQAAAILGEPARAEAAAQGIQDEHFEVLYQGRVDALKTPASTILMREKAARRLVNGSWAKTYLFADGHSEIHSEPTGDFTAWEQQRMVVTEAK